MLVVSELRAGTMYEENGQLLQVLTYEHIKLGRGSATIKVKVKNVRSGAIAEKSFINGAKVKDVEVPKKELQYLYKDPDSAYFMHPATFEQIAIPLKLIPEEKFLKEGETYMVSFLEDEALSVIMPPKVDLKVVETGPAIKGNSATNVFKDAILENGYKTKVPLFIKDNDMIRVDTRTGEYTQRA